MASVSAVSAFASVLDTDVIPGSTVYVGDIMYIGIAYAQVSQNQNYYVIKESTYIGSALHANKHTSESKNVDYLYLEWQVKYYPSGNKFTNPKTVEEHGKDKAEDEYTIPLSAIGSFVVYGAHIIRQSNTKILEEYTYIYN